MILQFLTTHIVSFSRLAVFLFFLASSGFTSVIHICTMGASKCCDPSCASDHRACHDEELPAPGLFVKSQFECHVSTVVGGLNDIQSLLEKQSNQQSLKVELVAIPVSQTGNASAVHRNTLFASHSTNVSPPSVEKYVLNEAFLI